MAEKTGRTGWVLHYEDMEVIEALSAEQVGILIRAITAYDLTGERPTGLPVELGMAFKLLAMHLDEDKAAYQDRCEQQKANGMKGGRPRKNAEAEEEKPMGFSENPKNPWVFSETQQNPTKPKKPDYDSDCDCDCDCDNNIYITQHTTSSLEIDNSYFCAEPLSAASTPEAEAPPKRAVVSLSLKNGDVYSITQAEIDHWQQLYPAVDVAQEFRSMAGWCEANPGKRKTKSAINRFIQGWLSREQAKSREQPQTQPPQPPKRNVMDELLALNAKLEAESRDGGVT